MSLEIPTAGRWLQRPHPLSRGAWVEISAPSIGFCRRFRTHGSLPNPIFSRLAPALHPSTATFELPTLPSNQNSQSCFPPTTNDRSNSRRQNNHHNLQIPTTTMPRQRSAARPAPSRPTVPARTSTAPQSQHQTRPAATYAAPTTQARPAAPPAAAPAAGGGSGLFGQMASTAAYVPSPLFLPCP